MAWIPVVSLALNLTILIVSIGGFIKVLKNDLMHVQKDLKEIKDAIKSISATTSNLAERVSTIEGRLQ
ncbi:MAG: hypothetical protein ACTSQJ_18565 [Promethearchaeota archaeon]